MLRLRWKSWPLAVKLTMTITLLVIAIVVSVTVLSIRREQQNFQAEMEQQAQLILNSLLVSASDALYFLDVDKLASITARLPKGSTVLEVRFYDAEGRILADSQDSGLTLTFDLDPLGQRLVERETIAFEWQPDRLVAGQSVRLGRQPAGAVSIALSTTPLEAKLNAVRNQGIGVALIAVVVGVLLARQISNSIANPLHKLAKVTEAITAGDLTQKIEFSSGDEVGMLATAFNSMTARLQIMIDSLEQHGRELENRNRELIALQAAGTVVASSLDQQRVFETVACEMIQLLEVDTCAIFEWDRKSDSLVLAFEYSSASSNNQRTGVRTESLPLADYPLRKQVLNESSILQITANQPEVDPAELAILKATSATTMLLLPMTFQDQALGLVELTSRIERTWSQHTFSLTHSMVNQAANAMNNAYLYEQARREIGERERAELVTARQAQALARSNAFIAALSQVAAHITAAPDLDQILQTLGTELKQLGITCFLALQEPDSQDLLSYYLSSEPAAWKLAEKLTGLTFQNFRIPHDRWPISEIIERKQALIITDPMLVMKSWIPNMPTMLGEQVFRLVGVQPGTIMFHLPLMISDQLVGFLAVWGPEMHEEDLPALSVFANQLAAVIENARLYQQATREIAERKRAEEKIKTSLLEKEVLLQEIHHRVKNNLQVISSLLNLQSSYLKDEQALEIFKDSQNRVRSMALIHEKLYQSENLAHINFGDYMRELGAYLFRAQNAHSRGITLDIRADEVALDIDTAVPCGLILNELFSNTLKHAFPNGRTGAVCLELIHDNNGQLNLTVADNGVGFPPELDYRETESLGLQLVKTLVDQLDGTIELNTSSSGTEFKIAFAAP